MRNHWTEIEKYLEDQKVAQELKKNRKYYVRVRAYRKVNGVKKYGTYGKVQAIAKRPRS